MAIGAESVVIATDDELHHALKGYRMWDVSREAVLTFLRENPFLLPVLREARQKIADYFGESATARLSVSVDPELDDYRLLWIYVSKHSTPQEIFEEEEKFVEEWWLDAMEETDGLMHIEGFWRREE